MKNKKGWTYTIPEGFTAKVENGKIIVEKAESEDEKIRIELIRQFNFLSEMWFKNIFNDKFTKKQILDYLKKQKEFPFVRDVILGSPGLYYYNGERMHFKGNPVIEEKQKEQKSVEWTELTWKDIIELERIINNVHYDFSAGIGQESFGKEVLERFRSTKGIEYLDEAEQKYWREEEQKSAEYEEDSNDETKQSSPSIDIAESVKTGRIGALKNLLSYLKYERKSTQEEIKLSFIPCIEKLLKEIERKPTGWSEEEAPDETKQEWRDSIDIPGSIKTSRIGTLENLISYFKYERKATQEEIRISFIPCLENLLKDVENTNYHAEWSDEDTEMYINVASSLRGYACGLENEEHKKHIKKGLDWLENRFKSLRPQPKEQDVEKNPEDKSFEDEWKDYYNNSLVSRRPLNKREVAKHFYWFAKKNDWKPSKEQMEALKSTMYDYKDVPWYNQLVSLYNDLKKL